MKPTLHILSSPNHRVHVASRIDPFSMITWKFIHYMSQLGWPCVHYSVPGSDVDCEQVPCLESFGISEQENIQTYSKNAIKEIEKRKKSGDMILCFYGLANKAVADRFPDLKVIEPSIGYTTKSVFAPYRVFASYAHLHMYYGERDMLMNPSWFDAVIPNAITAGEFDYSETKSDYFLCFGRVIETKGIHVAIQTTEKTGQKLIIAGSGSLKDLGYQSVPDHVTEVGPCGVEERRLLMKNARAIFGATYYVEPFGNMVAEALMSGTPAITTDWGGFVDTVIPGVTGYRCREFKEFVAAVENIDQIKPADCRQWALDNFEDQVIYKKYSHYLDKIAEGNFYRS